MSAPKRRLGRGLDVLLGERPRVETGTPPRPSGVEAARADGGRPSSLESTDVATSSTGAARPSPGEAKPSTDVATSSTGIAPPADASGKPVAASGGTSRAAPSEADVAPTVAGASTGNAADLADAPDDRRTGRLLEIPVHAIRPNPQQPRQIFEAAALAELEYSIRELGVLVPILVRRIPSSGDAVYEIVAGERRWRAAAAAQLGTVPAIVRPVDDVESVEIAIVENLQRRDLDPLEEAMGFQHLLDRYSFTQERLAERVGKSRPAIANALRLLGLSDAVKAKLRDGSLSVGHGRALLALPAERREPIAERIAREGLSVRFVERLADRSTKRVPAVAKRSPDLEAVETRLRYRFGAPVAIVPSGAGGRIEIRFADGADLIRLVEVLGGDAG